MVTGKRMTAFSVREVGFGSGAGLGLRKPDGRITSVTGLGVSVV
jgi:hypothetical protein